MPHYPQQATSSESKTAALVVVILEPKEKNKESEWQKSFLVKMGHKSSIFQFYLHPIDQNFVIWTRLAAKKTG